MFEVLLVASIPVLLALAAYLAATIGYPETPAQRRKRYAKIDARNRATRLARRAAR